jgi:hypothetical protein
MTLTFALLLTVTCVMLTIVLLANLRGIAELRLTIAGFTTDPVPRVARLDAGRALPDALISALYDPHEETLIVFLSTGCETCWRVARDLHNVVEVPVKVCVIGENGDQLAATIREPVVCIDQAIAAGAAGELQVDVTPLAILQRDGYILGTAYGSSVSLEGLEGLLSPSRAEKEPVTS